MRCLKGRTDISQSKTDISQSKTVISQSKTDISQGEGCEARPRSASSSLFDTVYLLLSYSDIPLQYCLFTPELQWQPRGKRLVSQGWVPPHTVLPTKGCLYVCIYTVYIYPFTGVGAPTQCCRSSSTRCTPPPWRAPAPLAGLQYPYPYYWYQTSVLAGSYLTRVLRFTPLFCTGYTPPTPDKRQPTTRTAQNISGMMSVRCWYETSVK